MKKVIAFFLISFISTSLYSQTIFKGNYKHFSLDTEIGVPIFYGDIPNQFSLSFGIKGNWHFSDLMALSTELSLVNLRGYDKENKESFTNNGLKILAGGDIYLFNLLRIHKIVNFVQPTFGFSLGGFKSNIVKSLITQKENGSFHKRWTFCYQLAAGIKFKLTKSFDLNIKSKMNYTQSDWLDNYKPNVTANKHNDVFLEFSTGITYHFGEQWKKPIIWNNSKTLIIIHKKPKKAKTSKNATKVKPRVIKTNFKGAKDNSDEENNEFDCIIKF